MLTIPQMLTDLHLSRLQADLANAETMKMVASLTMSNSALIKQVATLTKEAKS